MICADQLKSHGRNPRLSPQAAVPRQSTRSDTFQITLPKEMSAEQQIDGGGILLEQALEYELRPERAVDAVHQNGECRPLANFLQCGASLGKFADQA